MISILFSRLRRPLPALFVAGLVLASSMALAPPAYAFGGEDPLAPEGPMAGQTHTPEKEWHHEAITEQGAMLAGFTNEAADSLAWNADYLDSYLYKPLWWVKGGFDRLKASLAQKEDLEKCHFDDLFDTPKINIMWRRYASGTLAGLVWAAQKNNGQGDVAAAQHILGASLHAVQDFYSHSNWIDKKERRKTTFFQTSFTERSNQPLYTGAYEKADHLGVKHHGKWLFSAAIFRRPGVGPLMDVACSAMSPLAGTPVCEQYKLSKTGESVRPDVAGVPLPADILVMAPKGIALDNTWSADIGVRQRGLTDVTGKEAYGFAHELAKNQTYQWLKTMEGAMVSAGYGGFWQSIKATGVSKEEREKGFDDLNRVAHQFLTAGPYPPTSAAEEYYLRVNIKTGTQGNAGTDSDIELKANGQTFLLDWLPHKIPGLAVNDFEKGDEDSYTVGPFTSMPREIELYNHSASNMEVLAAAGRAVINAVGSVVSKVGGLYSALTAKQADHIATNKGVWMPEQLDALTGAASPFQVELNGGGEGHYKVHGTLANVGEDEENWIIEVKMNTLECIKESKMDRFSNSDEPFVMSVLNPLPGTIQTFRTEPFGDVDSKESRNINHVFERVAIPKSSGMLTLAVSAMEHDSESRQKRDELLAKFAGQHEETTKDAERNFITTLGAAIAEDWRPVHLHVTAFSRLGRVQVGTVYDADINRWIKGKQSVKFPLDVSKMRQVALTDQLLPLWPKESPDGQVPAPSTPGEGTGAIPGVGIPGLPSNLPTAGSADLSKWEGTWAVQWGTLNLKKSGNGLHGSIRAIHPMWHTEFEQAVLDVSSLGDGITVEGPWKMTTGSSKGNMHWTIADDGMTFTGYFDNEGSGEPRYEQLLFRGQRLAAKPTDPTAPPATVTTPGTTPPTVGNETGTGLPGGSPGGQPATIGNGFVQLPSFDAQIDKVQVGRAGTTLEVFATLKNPGSRARRLLASTIDLIVTDADGIGMKSLGNLYAYDNASNQPLSLIAAQPSAQIRARFIVELPRGTAALKTLSIREGNSQVHTFDLSKLEFAAAGPSAKWDGLSAGNNAFQSVGGTWDVRFDGIRSRRAGGHEAFVTVKNTASQPMPFISYQAFLTQIYDAAQGPQKSDGNAYRLSGSNPLTWARPIIVEPDGEAKVAFVFVTPTTFKPTKISFKDKSGPSTLEIPLNLNP